MEGCEGSFDGNGRDGDGRKARWLEGFLHADTMESAVGLLGPIAVIAHFLVEGDFLYPTFQDGMGESQFLCPCFGRANNEGAETLVTVIGQYDDAPQHDVGVVDGIEATGGYG